MLALGWATLVLGLISGYECARRVFKESCRLSQVIATPAISIALLLLSGAYLRPYLKPPAITIVLMLLAGTLLVLLRRLPLPEDLPAPLPWHGRLYLLLGGLMVGCYALFERTTGMVVEGDFFVHASSMGLFEEGHYPPLNVFLGVPAHGHFGRQLIIASLGGLSGLRFLEVDWLYTTIIQMTTFGLLFVIFWRGSGSVAQGVFGSFFAFFAANCSHRIGLAELVSNHNPTAYLFLAVTTWGLFRGLERAGLAVVGAGTLLGATAMVYETHFGLMGLALPFLLIFTFRDRKTVFKRFVPIVVLALIVAATEGGTITELASRVVRGGNSHETNVLSQQVTLEIPKSKLFHVRYDNMRPSRPFETLLKPWDASFHPNNKYYFTFSPRIRAVFWFPLWLSPLCFLYLLRKGHRAGVWFGTVGAISWMVPSVVGFGFFEGEALRWLFVGGLGGSICCGLIFGILWDRYPRRLPRAALLLTLLPLAGPGLWVSLGDMVSALANPGTPLPIGRPGVVPGVGLIPRPLKLLSHHHNLTSDDFGAADWLRENSDPDHRILVDDDDELVNVRCTTIGLQGRYPAAYLPPVVPSTDPSVYRRRLQVTRFWASGDARLLLGLDIDWILLHRSQHPADFEERFAKSPWCELKHRVGDISLYRCQLPSPEAKNNTSVHIVTAELPPEATCGEGVSLDLSLLNTGENEIEWLTFQWKNSEDKVVGGPMWEPVALKPLTRTTLRINLIAPHEEDTYRLEFACRRSADASFQTLGEVKAETR